MAIRQIKSGVRHAHIYLNLILVRTVSRRYAVKGCVTLVKDAPTDLMSEVWGTLAVFDNELAGVEFMDTLANSWGKLDAANVN